MPMSQHPGLPGISSAELQRLRALLKSRSGLDVSRMSDQEVLSQARRYLGINQALPAKPVATSGSKPHFLVAEGLRFLQQQHAIYGTRKFPAGFYEELARHLFDVALSHSHQDYGDAFSLLNELQFARLGTELQREYERLVGTDSTNGWDKFRHFVFTAYLQYKSSGVLAPEVFTYGKEAWDEAEQWVGSDPEGYSIPDIRADNRGEAFAEQMRRRELHEWFSGFRRWLGR